MFHCAQQLKHKTLDLRNPQGLQDAQSVGTLAEMAMLQAELLADNIKHSAIKLFTKVPDLKEVLT